MSKKKVGKSGCSVEFDGSAIGDVAKTLMAIEPAFVEQAVARLTETTRQVVDLVKSKIPPGYDVLRNSIIGKIVVYQGGRKIFVTVGASLDVPGGMEYKRSPSAFARWQEYGYQGSRWKREKELKAAEKQLKEAGIGRGRKQWKGLKLLINAHKKRVEAGHNFGNQTTPKRFIRDSRDRSREMNAAALETALKDVASMFESGELERQYGSGMPGDQYLSLLNRLNTLEKREIIVQ